MDLSKLDTVSSELFISLLVSIFFMVVLEGHIIHLWILCTLFALCISESEKDVALEDNNVTCIPVHD